MKSQNKIWSYVWLQESFFFYQKLKGSHTHKKIKFLSSIIHPHAIPGLHDLMQNIKDVQQKVHSAHLYAMKVNML